MENLKKWFSDTFSLAYLKKLINSDTNDDLKEFIALLLSFVLTGIIVYATIKADNDSGRLSIIYAVMMFIGTLFGIETVNKIQSKYSDNKSNREIEISKNDRKD